MKVEELATQVRASILLIEKLGGSDLAEYARLRELGHELDELECRNPLLGDSALEVELFERLLAITRDINAEWPEHAHHPRQSFAVFCEQDLAEQVAALRRQIATTASAA
jgi:hypothetical protein